MRKNKKANILIVAGDILQQSEQILKEQNIQIIKTDKCIDVYDEISYHTDIQMINIGNNIVIAPNMYDKYIDVLKQSEINYIKGESILKNKYPENVQYNGCIIGKYFIHNLQYTDKKVIELLEKNEYICINVKQGYTKCNISIVDENSIITQDKGIAKELSKYFDVLCINEKENISLGNMQGFIGGATGLISQNLWCINGDINRLKDCNKIIDFVTLKNKEILCLNNEEVIDIGSIIPIYY